MGRQSSLLSLLNELPMRCCFSFSLLLVASQVEAQAPIRMEERLAPNVSYHVNCRVQIAGKMTLPDKIIDIEGKSNIEYDERVLRVNDAGVVDKTLRLFANMEFERKVGTDLQKSTLRPAVYRLVVVRQNNIEAPFSPDGPLKMSEIDLIRTDVFTPALVGMLPKIAVSPGDSWKADESSARELTDLVQIKGGDLTCRFEKADSTLAKVSFRGTISGVGENGPTKHELDGFYYFDLTAHLLTYVSLKGTEHLLNAKNEAQGKVTGTFVLTREAKPAPAAIDESVSLTLDPNEDNTRLLFEDDETGLQFVHARKWKPRVEESQVKLDDLRGNGLVVTVDPLSRLPSLQQFLNEARGGFERRKGQVTFVSPSQMLQRQPTTVETLVLDAELPSGQATQRATVVLAVIRDESAGATLAATLVTTDRTALVRDVERLASSIRVGRAK
jgi:hypothetical protein